MFPPPAPTAPQPSVIRTVGSGAAAVPQGDGDEENDVGIGDFALGGGARPRGGRLPRRERRAQLLESALEVFVAQGYHAAAMDDIAERAGVSKPVLYQHFPGKLDLYLALLDESCAAVIAQCREALSSTGDNKLRVTAAIKAFYDYVAAETGAFRLVFESDLTSEPAVRAQVERVTSETAELVADVIRDDTGLPDEAARLLAVSLVGMAQVSARFWLSETSGITIQQAVDLVSGLAWRGIRGYPKHDEHEDGTPA
ncbi:TetR/AcrR family transcriptional regulator [Nocardioides sp. ChNu-153]|nr:TetR/AcrR family transcriptional regulator [Nocardioides sp. ChNu-99]MDN7120864.1 TetR/AcrR family transcriptional regulator [Nocardioides sp. ChNu-153]